MDLTTIKLIDRYSATLAAVHNNQVFEELLNETSLLDPSLKAFIYSLGGTLSEKVVNKLCVEHHISPYI